MAKRRTATVPRPASTPTTPPITAATRWAGGADRVVEGAILTAVAAVPLYFSLLDTTFWETDKAVLLIAFSVVAGAAWLLGALLRPTTSPLSGAARLILTLGLLTYGAYVLGTILSINPQYSLFGSISRHEGLITRTAYVIFFLCVATRVRTRSQVERLLTVILFAAIPAVAYGFFQRMGLDPIPSRGDPAVLQWPVRSTFGQHIFFGAYLVLLIPLTASRVLRLWEERHAPTVRAVGDESIIAAGLPILAAASIFGVLAVVLRADAASVILPLVFASYAAFGLAVESLPRTVGVQRIRLYSYGLLLALEILDLVFTGARGPQLGFIASVPVFLFLLAWYAGRTRLWSGILAISTVCGVIFILLNISGGPLQSLRNVHGLSSISHIVVSDGNQSSAHGRLEIWQGVTTLLTQTPPVGNGWGGPLRDIVGYGPDTMPLTFQRVFPLKLRRETFEVYTWDRAHDIYLDIAEEAGLLGLLAFLATIGYTLYRTVRSVRSWDRYSALLATGAAAAIAGHLIEGVFGIETAASLLLLWVILGVSAREPVPPETEEVPAPRHLGLALGFGGGATLLLLLFGLPLNLPTHPILLASVWTLAVVAGIVLLALMTRPALVPASARTSSPVPTDPTVTRTRAIAGAVALLAILALLTQWRLETAAYADAEGASQFVTGQFQAGLSNAELATQAAGYVDTYRSDLAQAYLSMARVRGASADPSYRPSPGDARSLDPQTALTLGKAQLFALAVDAQRQTINLVPQDPTAYSTLGDFYYEWKQNRQAAALYRQAESLSPDNPRYLDQQALSLLAAGQAGSALRLARQATALDDGYWYSHYAQAVVAHQLGRSATARTQARLALFWAPVALPQPPASDLNAMRKMETTG